MEPTPRRSSRRPLADDAPVHPHDLVRADPAVADRPDAGADVVHDGAALPQVHDLSDLELLVGRREDLMRNGPVSLVDGELHADLVDPLRPERRDLPRLRAVDASAPRLDRRDRDAPVASYDSSTRSPS